MFLLVKESSDYLICVRNVLPHLTKYYLEVIRTAPVSKIVEITDFKRS